MVGAKQFAIMRKIIKKKMNNPVGEEIELPIGLSGKKAFKATSGSFMDKIDAKRSIETKPNLKPVDPLVDILDDFMFPSFMQSHLDIEKPIETKSKSKKEEEISEEVINKITYQVFQNIRNYLDSEREAEEDRKKVKIEICI